MSNRTTRLKVVKDLFDRCADAPVSERDELLASSEASPEEQREVERLLTFHDTADINAQQTHIIGQQLRTLSQSIPSGQKLGAFAIEEEIGQGGMGIVFRARRADGSYDQQVAIKIAPSFASAEELKHFHQERQILAKLQHPNIATLLDGGATDDSRPYLVMEYVSGKAIHEHCLTQKLNLRARLQLFVEVCKAVSYAHNQLIIHRDIKPENVLVTEQGQVKLLDFGIGKALQGEADRTNATALQGMTLAYASPEQIRGERTTMATDVYGLGALLYCLLTGRSPHGLGNNSAEQAVEAICHTETAPPSRVPGDTGGIQDRRSLRGDLDNIVSKALRKEPERRYDSARDLQRDIERYLNREPVLATPSSLFYRAGRVIARHPAASALAASVVMAINLGLAASLYLADQLRTERDSLLDAQREIKRQMYTAERTTALLTGMFEAASPARAQGPTVNVDQILQDGARKIRETLDNDPAVKSQLLKSLAQLNYNVGKYHEAATLQQEALQQLDSAALLPTEFSAMEAAHMRAELLIGLGRYQRESGAVNSAATALAEAFTLLEQHPDKHLQAQALHRQGQLISRVGSPDDAIEILNAAKDIWQQMPDQGGALGLANNHSLSNAYFNKPDFPMAAETESAVLAERIKLLGESHPDTLNSYRFVARSYMRVGRWQEARELAQRAYQVSGKIFSAENKIFRHSAITYARLLGRLGDFQAAADVLNPFLAGEVRELETTAELYHHRGYFNFHLGHLALARADLERAVEILGKIYPHNSDSTFLPRANLGEAMAITGDVSAGIELINQVKQENIVQYGADDYGVASWNLRLARIALHRGKLQEARELNQLSQNINLKTFSHDHPIVLQNDETEMRIALAQGDTSRAIEICKRLIETYESIFPLDAPIIGRHRQLLKELTKPA
ncbi:serine/threonine-protein kinase [Microbulbifer agarilyticus]|uniref:serine/threonine-protein kinase n=1 Tax=Microbulbifer agarilyticus TaxID=260552 RepID=UPI001C960F29|nr:serine/threonine-protein kinase [Microbulbifer agarilyticus]MBY6191752.1 serine/threonine-protein kinase [Microbulbifer agarilyticus]